MGARDVAALHLEQKLTLLNRITEPGINFHDSTRSERRDWHLPRHVGANHAGYIQLRRGNVLTRRDYRKLLGVLHLEIVGIHVRLHSRRELTSARHSVFLGRDLPLATGDEKAHT
jgi:hypothetical protein